MRLKLVSESVAPVEKLLPLYSGHMLPDWVAYTESACSHVSDIKSLASYQLLSSFSTGWAVKRDKTISLEEGGRIRSAKLARMVEPSQKSSQKECLILRDRR